jgi:2,3-bisphosphoglycerate-dependent phosphoglycerate mutase
MHGIEFDVVYTSWLSRAIETGWLVLNELDSLWLPIHKTWRLNERMYGALTGLSKKMIGQRHGQSQLKLWRRSYATRPPRTSSFAASYPGNDDRYCKYVKDIRYSVFESVIRSLAHGKVELHRKFPYTESLQDCMERTIPYLTNVIMPDSVSKGRKVLIASSENAIRGLLMHLLDIPTDVIHQVEIPTGLPLVFDLNSRCLKLLDDGTEDLLSRYDFGAAPELLFRPCNAEVETDSDTCFIGDDGRMYVTDPIIRLPQRTKKIERPYFVR